MGLIIAIDPGCTESGYVVVRHDENEITQIVDKGKVENEKIFFVLKWFADNNGGEWYGCYMFHVVRITTEDAPKPDDFCSYGERKNGGDSDV